MAIYEADKSKCETPRVLSGPKRMCCARPRNQEPEAPYSTSILLHIASGDFHNLVCGLRLNLPCWDGRGLTSLPKGQPHLFAVRTQLPKSVIPATTWGLTVLRTQMEAALVRMISIVSAYQQYSCSWIRLLGVISSAHFAYINKMSIPTGFRAHDPTFRGIVGSSPSLQKIFSNASFAFAHEAGAFFSDENELWVTSNRIYNDKGEQHVITSKIRLSADRIAPPKQEEVTIESFHMGNGGVNYESGILFCSQGSATIPSGLYYTDPRAPQNTQPILTSIYEKPFNSVNDVIIAQDGSIWFTDPPYGFEQGYKGPSQLPS